jgi:antitoxin component YwqK of YwqJK toxin-antitoxin module
MHQLRSLRPALAALGLLAAGLPFIAQVRIVSAPHPGLKKAPFGYHFQEQPLNGLLMNKDQAGTFTRVVTLWSGRFWGPQVRWYASGNLREVSFFWNGQEHGTRRVWHDTGEPSLISHYEHGKKVGESWGWHPDGSTALYARYVDDQEVALKTYNSERRPFHNWITDGARKVGFTGKRNCDRANFIR